MATLLGGTVQPPLISLLNSTSTPALSPLWSTHTDPSDPSSPDTSGSTSFLAILSDTSARPNRRKWDSGPDERVFVPRRQPERGDIVGNVIHLQSRTSRRAWIQAGVSVCESQDRKGKGRVRDDRVDMGQGHLPLGVELPFVHIQAKALGHRGWAFEVGVVDTKGREGAKEPAVYRSRRPPLLHLPLSLPKQDATSTTAWFDVGVNLAQLLPLFQTLPSPSPAASSDDEGRPAKGKRKRLRVQEEVPNAQFAYVSYVRVYANCRLRRVWLSAQGGQTLEGLGTTASRDFALFAT